MVERHWIQSHRADYEVLTQKLKAARLDAGLTQVQVAVALGKPQSFVSKVESGERKLDPVELSWFARLYSVQLTALMPPFEDE